MIPAMVGWVCIRFFMGKGSGIEGVEFKKGRKKPSDWLLYRQKFFEV